VITGAQARTGRQLLNWSQADLAARTGARPWDLIVFENNLGIPPDLPIAAIQKALEEAGAEFVIGNGEAPSVTLKIK
jgi:hypothetical protein